MPLHKRTKTELEKLPSYFEFLATVPYIDEHDDSRSEDDCPICRERFEWDPMPGETMNRPVKLTCGHVFGIQCFAQWMLSPTFDGLCPFCRAIVLDPTRPQVQNPIVTAAVTNLEVLCLFQDRVCAMRKGALLDIFEKALPAELQDRDRLMMLWEEFLDSMCDDPSKPETAPEQLLRAPLVDQRAVLREKNRLVACLFFLGGILTTVQFVSLWYRHYGDTLEALRENLAIICRGLYTHIFELLVGSYLGRFPILLPLLDTTMSMLLFLIQTAILVAFFYLLKELTRPIWGR